MKLGQLIEYNMSNIFLKKSYTKCDGEASLKCCYCMSKTSVPKYVKTKFLTTCFYLI